MCVCVFVFRAIIANTSGNLLISLFFQNINSLQKDIGELSKPPHPMRLAPLPGRGPGRTLKPRKVREEEYPVCVCVCVCFPRDHSKYIWFSFHLSFFLEHQQSPKRCRRIIETSDSDEEMEVVVNKRNNNVHDEDEHEDDDNNNNGSNTFTG